MKNVLITQGGCGTASLQKVTTNVINGDVHIHERYPESMDIKYPNSKVVYLFGNPYDCLMSLARRDKFLLEHCHNLKCFIPLKENKFHQFCKDDRSNFPTGTPEEILEIYLDFDQDIYNFKDHYERWKNLKDKTYSIRFIKYEGLKNNGITPLNEWWDTNINWNFAGRTSNYKQLDERLFSKLENMYGKWFDEYQKLPEIEDFYAINN